MKRVDYSKIKEKRCSRCEEVKPVSEFYRMNDARAPVNGWRYHSLCRECCRDDNRDREKNRMRRSKKLTYQYLIENIRYDEPTGELWWKVYIPNRRMDRPIGTVGPDGYLIVRIGGKTYAVHRIIWFLIYGRWPAEVDHINGNRKDNRLENLREVTRQENASNRYLSSNNTSGHCGVWFNAHPKVRMWYAGIKTNGKTIHLGAFKRKEDAVKARKRAEREYPSFTSRHGTRRADAE